MDYEVSCTQNYTDYLDVEKGIIQGINAYMKDYPQRSIVTNIDITLTDFAQPLAATSQKLDVGD